MNGRRVGITGVGVVNAAMAGNADVLAAWLGASRPTVGAPRATEDPDQRGAAIDADRLTGLLGADERRRLSRICQLAVAAGRLALNDAGLSAERLGVVVGTELGDLRSTVDFADGFLRRGAAGLSALLFPNTVMNTMASAMAIAMEIKEMALTLTAPLVAGELAVSQAAAAVAAGRLDAALAGGVDEFDGDVHAIVAALGRERDVRGDGAAFIVLEPLEAARRRGARVLGEIRGAAWRALRARPWGAGRASASPAIADALAAAGTTTGAVRWIYGSAGGDASRDAWERTVLEGAFAGRVPQTTTLASALGQHSGLGAVGVAAAAWTAWSGRLPSATFCVKRGNGPSEPTGPGPGLVHGLARGGTQVVLVVDRGDDAVNPWGGR